MGLRVFLRKAESLGEFRDVGFKFVLLKVVVLWVCDLVVRGGVSRFLGSNGVSGRD